jgi:D,D-heptose 1,7-bisphosphate phosphatase
MKNKAIFLDRDGTINIDGPYLADPEKFIMYSGVGEGVKALKENGFKIIVITNQSGIARGYFTEEILEQIHEKMRKEFKKFDVELDGIYYCPHHPNDNCECRKPKTQLFETAIREHSIDVTRSYMIGDKIQDVIAGKKIGVKTILISNLPSEQIYQKEGKSYIPNHVATNFTQTVEWILCNKEKGRKIKKESS